MLTAADLEERFGLPGGDIFHGAMTLDQLWTNRPVMGYAAYRGPIKGLYHCGAGAHPGGASPDCPGETRRGKCCATSSYGEPTSSHTSAPIGILSMNPWIPMPTGQLDRSIP